MRGNGKIMGSFAVLQFDLYCFVELFSSFLSILPCRFTAQLRESVVQIHNVASLLAEAQSLKSSPYCSENSTHEESLLEVGGAVG